MALLKDIWRVGVIRTQVADLTAEALANAATIWLPNPGPLRFLADPFGLWRDGRLHLFAETYDYRDRVGAIDLFVLDAELRVLEQRPALREPWHLSYPYVFEADGETWMLPEAFRSGRLTLYRAERFPDRWTPETTIALDHVPIDATPVFHDGLWWLFYAPAGSRLDKVAALHVAWAERLTGPWTPHPLNPVRYDPASARPGGTPFISDGDLILPVQDCSRTYGGGLRRLRITTLTPDRFEAAAEPALVPPPAWRHFVDGLHTLAAAGDVTLIDAKHRQVSPQSLLIDARRLFRKR